MPVITTIDDLKRLHERRVPRMFYDYAESGSWTEQTFRENTTDFEQIRLRQRVAVDMSGRSTKTQMIGQDVAMPVALAPVGLTGIADSLAAPSSKGAPVVSSAPTMFPAPETLA